MPCKYIKAGRTGNYSFSFYVFHVKHARSPYNLIMENSVKQFSLPDLEQMLVQVGVPKFRTMQIASWLYVKRARSFDEMTNLPSALRLQLSQTYPFTFPEIADLQVSGDGTRKYLLKLMDGTLVETVGIPSDDNRLTVCCSSQAGCAMGCLFCATGKQGLVRNLLPGEIVDQINVVGEDFGRRVSNVVVMGQGEPFANYRNLMGALRILNHGKLLDIGARHITVSTCGIIPKIADFASEDEQFTLAVSLHSADQGTRDLIMPELSRFPLTDLRKSLGEYSERTGRRVSLEYALIEGVNDSARELDCLVRFCKGLLCHVNLIMLNPIPDSPFKPVPTKSLKKWLDELERHRVNATVRQSRGGDIDGACGQLANSILKP